MTMKRSEAVVAIVCAVLPALITEIGGALRDRAARNAPCPHGRPGGRLCNRCKEDA